MLLPHIAEVINISLNKLYGIVPHNYDSNINDIENNRTTEPVCADDFSEYIFDMILKSFRDRSGINLDPSLITKNSSSASENKQNRGGNYYLGCFSNKKGGVVMNKILLSLTGIIKNTEASIYLISTVWLMYY